MDTASQTQTTLRDLVALVFRQKWVILIIFGVTTASVWLFNLRSDTTYESAARVQVRRGRMESAQNTSVRVLAWEEEMASELETVGSLPVAQGAQEILNNWFQEGKTDKLYTLSRSGVQSRVIGESNVLEITYTSSEVSACIPVTNAITEAYTIYRHGSFEIPGVDEFFSREKLRVQTEIEALEEKKRLFLESVNSATGSEMANRLNSLLLDAEKDLRDVESKLAQYRRQLRAADQITSDSALDNEDSHDSAYFMELGFKNVSTLYNLRIEYVRAKLAYDELAARLTPAHPDMKAAHETLESAKTLLSDEIGATKEVLLGQIREYERKQADLTRQIQGISDRVQSIPTNEIEVSRLDHQIDLLRREMLTLNQKETASRVNKATAPNVTVTLLSPAGPPYAKKTKDYVRMVLAPLMSLGVGLVLAFFLDGLDHSLRTSAEVEDKLGLPVLATVPERRS